MSVWLLWKRGAEMTALVALIAGGSWLVSIATAGIVVIVVDIFNGALAESLIDPLSMIAVGFFFPLMLGGILNAIDRKRGRER